MRTRGSTLLEVSVSMSIAALVFLIVGGIFIAQGRYFAIEDAIAETQYNAFQVLDTVGLYATSARAVVSGRTINGTAYASGTSTVVLELPSIDAGGDVIASSYDYVALGVYGADPTRFVVDIDAATGSDRVDATRLPAALVETVIFRYNAVSATSATAIDLYVRTEETVRNRVIRMPLGKSYYLGSS